MKSGFPSRSDICFAIKNSEVFLKADELIGAEPIKQGGNILPHSGGYSIVFPFLTKDQKKIAVKCWIYDIGEAKRRTHGVALKLNSLNVPYFANTSYVENALLINQNYFPVVIMDWMEGQKLKDYIHDNIHENECLLEVAKNFKDFVKYMHRTNLAHGDLQHDNILIRSDKTIAVVDYDSMYVEALSGMSDNIKGKSGYQHPSRIKNEYLNVQLDYFSELVIYLSLLIFAFEPDLWPIYFNSEYLLFSIEDFKAPQKSDLFKKFISVKDKTISHLTRKLLEYLNEESILTLHPLEKILGSDVNDVIDNLKVKWKNSVNSAPKRKWELPDVDPIVAKFKKND